MPLNPRAAFDQLVRGDFQLFVEQAFHVLLPSETYNRAWYIQAICWHLHVVRSGGVPRLIVNLPPRTLKSLIVTVMWPAFLLGQDPTLRIICVSYSDELSREHARLFRLLIDSAFYKRLFPKMQVAQNTEGQVTTTENGFRLSTSIGGTLTGKGGNLIIIDDPIKAGSANSAAERQRVVDWFTSTLMTRLDDPVKSQIVVVMQRVHAYDLSGYLLEKGGWDHLCLPGVSHGDQNVPIGPGKPHLFEEGTLLDHVRLPSHVLEARFGELGSAQYHAQYIQDPVPPGGNIIKREWLRYFDPASPPRFHQVIQSWDVAAKIGASNDYSVCITVGIAKDGYYVLDVQRMKVEFPNLLYAAKRLAAEHRVDRILIEESSSGIGLLQWLQREPRLNALGIKPHQDKESRVHAVAASFEAGKVKFAKGASWLEPFERELLEFPNSKHDDQVDSMSQALSWARDFADDYRLSVLGIPDIPKEDYQEDYASLIPDDDDQWDYLR